jgi:hypothetical protein
MKKETFMPICNSNPRPRVFDQPNAVRAIDLTCDLHTQMPTDANNVTFNFPEVGLQSQ